MNDLIPRINQLISDTACCSHTGCRCWQAVSDLRDMRDYCNEQIKKSRYDDLKETDSPSVCPKCEGTETIEEHESFENSWGEQGLKSKPCGCVSERQSDDPR